MGKTPSEKWSQMVVKYRKQCQSILALSKNVRYVGVINAYGRTLAGIVNPKVKPLLGPEPVKNEFFAIHMLMNMRKESSKTLGSLGHMLLQHSKVSIIALYKGNVVYYVSVDKKEKDLDQIISSVKKTI